MTELPAPTPVLVSENERRRIIIGVLVALLLAALDQTIVAPAIPAMGQGLGGSQYISWIVSAYFLTSTATTPLYGKFADIHGRRPTLYAALAIFVTGSIICALATSMWILIAGRAVQGLGGGGLMTLAQIVIADLVPPKERGRYSVHISTTWAIASIGGPILGGAITQHLSWQVIFWINLPIAVFAVLMTWNSLLRLPWHKREHRLDILGSLMVVLATVAFMLALAFGPQAQFGWASPVVLGLFAAGVLLMPLIARHMLTAPEPLIPLAVLGNPVILTASFSVFFAVWSFIGLTVYIPLFLELTLGQSPEQAGFDLVAYMVSTVAGASFIGQRMPRVTHYKRLPLIGLAVAGAGLIWLAIRADTIGLVETELVLIVIGTGSGMQFPVTTVSVQNAASTQNIGVATAVLAFLRALGSSVGVAILGAVGAASGISAGLAEAGPGGMVQHLSGSAFRPVFIAAAISLAISWAMLALMPVRPLRGHVAPSPPPVSGEP